MGHGQTNKTRLIGVRMTVADAQSLRGEALECALTMSELIRRRISGRLVVSRTDRDTARSIDQLGRMLKHLYPKGQGWAAPEERRRWWVLVSELERIAKVLRGSRPSS